MNENEKDVLDSQAAENVSDTPASAPEAGDACKAATACECVETTSPAMDLAETAEELDPADNGVRTHTSGVAGLTKEDLVGALKKIVEEGNLQAHREVATLRMSFYSLQQREIDRQLEKWVEDGNAPESFVAAPDMAEAEFKALHAEFKEKRAAYLEEEENRRQANLARKLGIIDSIRELTEDVDNINRNYPRFSELQNEFKAIKEIPAQAETDIWKQYQAEVERFYDLLKLNKELRDLDFKKNLELKRQLIERAKELTEMEDVIEAARRLQTLHEEWREIGPVAKEIREEIWDEFRSASTVVNKRHQEYFDRRKEQESANEAAKTKLCEEVENIDTESLKSYVAWDREVEKVVGLQARWKEIGPAPRKVNGAIYSRFRKACDDFFKKRSTYYREVKALYRENLAKKEDLCKRAEALLADVNAPGSREALLALQEEWKSVGPAERKYSDQVWERFSKTCNAFFDARRSQREEKHTAETANLAAKREIVEKIKALPLDGDRREVIAAVRQLQSEWQSVGHVPYKHKESLGNAYRKACDAVYDAYEATRNKEKMTNYRERLTRMRNDRRGILSERDKLNDVLSRKRNDLATYENNMGFFSVKSSAGNAMLKELERKIARIKVEIEEVEQKIKMIDNPAPAAEAPAAEASASEENKQED